MGPSSKNSITCLSNSLSLLSLLFFIYSTNEMGENDVFLTQAASKNLFLRMVRFKNWVENE